MGSASPRRRPGGRGLFAATLPRVLARSGGANRVAGRAAREDAIARRCGVRRRDVYFVLSVRRRPGQVPEVHGRDLEREGRAMDEARAQLPGRQPLLVAPGSSASQDSRCSAEQVRTRPAPQRALRQTARARTRPQGRAPEVCNRGAAALPLRVQSRQAPARAHEDVRHDTPDAQTPRGAVSAGACGRPLAPQRTSREPHLCAVRVSTASAGASDAGRHRAAQPWPGGGARGCSRIPRKPSPQRRSLCPAALFLRADSSCTNCGTHTNGALFLKRGPQRSGELVYSAIPAGGGVRVGARYHNVSRVAGRRAASVERWPAQTGTTNAA